MDISLAGFDLIILWKVLSKTAKLYTVFFLVSGSYATYSLVRVFAGFAHLRETAALKRLKLRVANIRQIILLVLLLFGAAGANEAFVWFRTRSLGSNCGDCSGGPGILAEFAVVIFAVLALLHAFQWIASVLLQRRSVEFSG
jgi:hypothetical protein